MTNLIVLATYWNEVEWIEASLEQIELIDPVEVIVCDGCFDPLFSSPSTDGTREIIQEFVDKRTNARLVSPLRPEGIIDTIKAVRDSFRWSVSTCITDFLLFFEYFRVVAYRRNQALTFNQMKNMSTYWKPGSWFMTYDCDQFYPNEMIEFFKKVVNDTSCPYDVLTADEYTFFQSFNQFTLEYEVRKYNNMPHRIFTDTVFRPTRVPHRRGFQKLKKYVDTGKKLHVGQYFHYKLKQPKRYGETYVVGDRKAPDIGTYEFNRFRGSHPSIIKKHFI